MEIYTAAAHLMGSELSVAQGPRCKPLGVCLKERVNYNTYAERHLGSKLYLELFIIWANTVWTATYSNIIDSCRVYGKAGQEDAAPLPA